MTEFVRDWGDPQYADYTPTDWLRLALAGIAETLNSVPVVQNDRIIATRSTLATIGYKLGDMLNNYPESQHEELLREWVVDLDRRLDVSPENPVRDIATEYEEMTVHDVVRNLVYHFFLDFRALVDHLDLKKLMEE